MKGKKVYILKSTYKDGDSESLGVYDSPRAMVAGLAASIYEDHAAIRGAKPKEITKIVALAVFDFVSLCGFESDSVMRYTRFSPRSSRPGMRKR